MKPLCLTILFLFAVLFVPGWLQAEVEIPPAAKALFPAGSEFTQVQKPISPGKSQEIRAYLGQIESSDSLEVALFLVLDSNKNHLGILARTDASHPLWVAIGKNGALEDLARPGNPIESSLIKKIRGKTLPSLMRELPPGLDEALVAEVRKVMFVFYGTFVKTETILAALSAEDGGYFPVTPAPRYNQLKHLMGNAMMPNYKSLWHYFKHHDITMMKQVLFNLNQLGDRILTHKSPEKAKNLDKYHSFAQDLATQTQLLRASLDDSHFDRSGTSAHILKIYRICQDCHDIYAPAEGKEKRKYAPPR